MQLTTKVTSKEILRNFGEISDTAFREPVVITKNGRDRLVLLSIEAFDALVGISDDLEATQAAELESGPTTSSAPQMTEQPGGSVGAP